MHLSINGHTFKIGQLARGFVILNDPIELPPTQGEITMSIDGRVSKWRVHLPNGVSPDRLRTAIGQKPLELVE
jgi:hypothetical protein